MNKSPHVEKIAKISERLRGSPGQTLSAPLAASVGSASTDSKRVAVDFRTSFYVGAELRPHESTVPARIEFIRVK
jgi:hypothetical protein